MVASRMWFLRMLGFGMLALGFIDPQISIDRDKNAVRTWDCSLSELLLSSQCLILNNIASTMNNEPHLTSNSVTQPVTTSFPQATKQQSRDASEPSLLHRSLLTQPHKVVSASGSYLFLADGRKILDGCGGAAVSTIGHGNPEVSSAVLTQMQKVSYVHTATYTTSSAEDLAHFLLYDPTSTFEHHLEKAYFVGSGSEANDSAMKLARQYFVEKGELDRTIFVARRQGYHGSTVGAMSISANVARKKQFEGVLTLSNVVHVAPAYAYQYKLDDETDVEYSKRLVRELDEEYQRLDPMNVIAFFAETVVGATTGCVPAPPGYFAGVLAGQRRI